MNVARPWNIDTSSVVMPLTTQRSELSALTIDSREGQAKVSYRDFGTWCDEANKSPRVYLLDSDFTNYAVVQHPQITVLKSQMQRVEGQMAGLEQAIKDLAEAVETLSSRIEPRVEVIELRDISRDQVKKEIKALFDRADKPLYYDEIADELRLDLETVVTICNELEEENYIGEATNV